MSVLVVMLLFGAAHAATMMVQTFGSLLDAMNTSVGGDEIVVLQNLTALSASGFPLNGAKSAPVIVRSDNPPPAMQRATLSSAGLRSISAYRSSAH